MRRRDTTAYARFREAAEGPMVVLALVFVPVAVVPLVTDLPVNVERALEIVSWTIWAVFAVEFAILMWLAPSRRAALKAHWLDAVIVVLPFLRPLRATRLLRLTRSGSVFARATDGARRLAGRRGSRGYGIFATAVTLGGALAVWVVEHDAPGGSIRSLGDGLWWSVVTATTVGYGDVSPVTPEGRAVAVVIMLVGIGLLGVVTANVAAYFIERDGVDDISELREQLARIETALAEIRRSIDSGS